MVLRCCVALLLCGVGLCWLGEFFVRLFARLRVCLCCGVCVCAVVYLCICSWVCLFSVLRCYLLVWLCVGLFAYMRVCLSV